MKQISLRVIRENLTEVTIGNLDLYYSYDTIVAYRDGMGLIGSQNVWSNTTGKHLNELGITKEERIKADKFDEMLITVLKNHNLTV